MEREASELIVRGAIPVVGAVPIGRPPGPDRLIRIANGSHVIWRQRHGVVRRVDHVDVRGDLLGETQGLAECGQIAAWKEEEHFPQVEEIADEECSRLSVEKGDATRRVTRGMKDLQNAIAEVDTVSMLEPA